MKVESVEVERACDASLDARRGVGSGSAAEVEEEQEEERVRWGDRRVVCASEAWSRCRVAEVESRARCEVRLSREVVMQSGRAAGTWVATA